MSSMAFRAGWHSGNAVRLPRQTGACVKTILKTLLVSVLPFAVWANVAAAEPPKPTPHARELAAQVIAILKPQAAFSLAVDDKTIEGLAAEFRRSLPDGVVPNSVMQGAVRDHLERMESKIIQGMVDIYAARFTEDQLSEMAAFYRSSAGQALISQTPSISGEVRQLAQRSADDMQVEIFADVCAKVECHLRPTPNMPKTGFAAFGGNPWEVPSGGQPLMLANAPKSSQPNDALVADFRCRIGNQGHLGDCVVDWEDQGGANTARMALDAISQSRLKSRLLDGTDPEGLFAQGRVLIFGDGHVELQLHHIGATLLAPLSHPINAPNAQNLAP